MKRFFWKDKNVLVTGATGFIGSNLVRELLKKGAHVFALTHGHSRKENSYFSLSEKKKIHFIQADVRDYEALAQVFIKNKIVVIFYRINAGS